MEQPSQGDTQLAGDVDEVGANEVGRGFDRHIRRGDTAPDVGVAEAEPAGEGAIGGRPIPHHDAVWVPGADTIDAEQFPHEHRHRFIWLAGHQWRDPARHRHGSQDGAGSRNRPIGGRVGGIVVCSHQSGTGTYSGRRPGHDLVIERSVEADDDGVDSTRGHDLGPPLLHRFHHTWPGADHDPFTHPHYVGGRLRRSHDSAGGRDPMSLELAFRVSDRRKTEVRHEEHTVPGGPQRANRGGRARDRVIGQPDHAVEVAQYRRHPFTPITFRSCHARGHTCRVPRFEPFPAIRYRQGLALGDVTAPPYDVLSEADLDALAARHPCNIVRIDVPRERDGDHRYVEAGVRLAAWQADGTLVSDAVPSFTIYRMRFTDEAGGEREISGVIGALEIVDEGAGGVLPHERTTPKAKTDRLDLTRNTGANLSPVWGLSLASGLTDLLEAPGERLGQFTDDDGVTHIIERVDDPTRTGAIATLVGSSDVVMADGHHRYAISRTYRDERRADNEGKGGPWDLTLAYINELVADQLSVAAIHRLYTEITPEAFRTALARCFDLAPAGPVDPTTTVRMLERASLCLVDADGGGTYLTPKSDAFEGVRDLDSARLEHALSGVIHSVAYQHGVAPVLAALRDGQATAAILIRPVPVDEIRRTARERLLMPPKSTFFTPKLKTGLVLRSVAE